MAEAATKSIRIEKLCPPGKPLGFTPPATGVTHNPARLKKANIRGTITTNGDVFTVLGLSTITAWKLRYEGTLPAVLPTATSATNVLTIAVTDGTVVSGWVVGT